MKLVHIEGKDNATKKCVISLGVGKPVFKLTLQRLGESLKRVGFDGDYLYWDESLPSGCPDQFEAPFAFKSYCFYKAKELGYEQVLWIDAPCVAIRKIAPCFRLIEEHGYIFFNNNYGQMMGQWSSDDALAKNLISREEALARVSPMNRYDLLGRCLKNHHCRRQGCWNRGRNHHKQNPRQRQWQSYCG